MDTSDRAPSTSGRSSAASRGSRYDGPVVFESFSSAVVNEDLSRMLGIWRNLWDDSDDLAAHANRFIRDQLRAVESISLH